MGKGKKGRDNFIPNPKHPMGYTWEEINTFMSKVERAKFCKWIYGQTCSATETGDSIFYTWDVKRFLALTREGTPTYFD
mgnify:CR=1 FL=1